jgi:CheY-like chemotaxis protein
MISKPSVLVVDDDMGTLETLADILRSNAYEVGLAESGSAAVAAVQRTRYAAVLMDLLMPGLTGVEAMRMIRASAPDTKVIIMTAFTHDALVEDAEREGALAVVPKPLQLDQVLSLLARATRGGGERGGRPA